MCLKSVKLALNLNVLESLRTKHFHQCRNGSVRPLECTCKRMAMTTRTAIAMRRLWIHRLSLRLFYLLFESKVASKFENTRKTNLFSDSALCKQNLLVMWFQLFKLFTWCLEPQQHLPLTSDAISHYFPWYDIILIQFNRLAQQSTTFKQIRTVKPGDKS